MAGNTFVLLKPDAQFRGLVGKIISRIEEKDMSIEDIRMVWPTREQLERHYSHIEENILDEICYFMAEQECIAMLVSGDDAIVAMKNLVGATEPINAAPGTIRGDFSSDSIAYRQTQPSGYKALRNLIHCSDSVESFEREIKIWFPEY